MTSGQGGALLAFAIAWCVATPASGQSPTAAAEALFDAGREAAAAGDHGTACEKFRESFRLEPGAGTLLNLGDCSEKLGRLLEAWQSYSEARKILAPDDRRMSYAEERFAAVDARIARLTLRVEEALPPGTVVEQDGVVLTPASFGVALPLEPGSVEVLVRAPGHEMSRRRLELVEGERRELSIHVGPSLPEPTPPSSAPIPPRPTSLPRPEPAPPPDETSMVGEGLGWTAVGVGAVLIGVGIGFTVDLAQRRAQLDEVCADGCPSSFADDVDAYNARRAIPPATFVAGAVLAAGGTLALVLLDDDASASARAVVGPSFAGLEGTW